MEKEITKRLKIDTFLKTGEDDTLKWDKEIKETKKAISKLKPKEWNEYYYSLMIEERSIKIFNRDATIIKFTPLEIVWKEDTMRHKLQWCPYPNPPVEHWIKIGDKMLQWNTGRNWFIDRIKPEQLERGIIKRTPEYQKAGKYISEYASKEIEKTVKTLKEKYPEDIFSELIRANTDPDYWY